MTSFEDIAAFGLDALTRGGEASDPNYIVVERPADLERLCAELFEERDYPIVGVTLRASSHEPVLRSSDIRKVVGADAHVYLVAEEDDLQRLQHVLGTRLRLWSGAIRVWWPGLSRRSDPGDHPVVVGLEGEDYTVTLEELAHEFDLSRPRVRSRVRLIEDSRAFLERELASAEERRRTMHERLRDVQIESHRLRGRAEAAEAGLAAASDPAEPE